MKRIVSIILIVVFALSLSAMALAAELPESKTGRISSGGYTLLKWEGDLSAVKGFRITFNITNYENYATSGDGADLQIVINPEWTNLSSRGGVFGPANRWGNTSLTGPTATYTYMLETPIPGYWFEVGVGNWNNMQGTFTVTPVGEGGITSDDSRPITSELTDPTEQYVDILYRGAFFRDPDEAGFDHWVKLINAGMSYSDVASMFYFSKEMADMKLTNKQFVSALYAGLLGRTPEKDEQELLASLLDRAATRRIVFNIVIQSTEFTERIKELG